MLVLAILIQWELVKPGPSLVTCLCQGGPKGLRWARPILVAAKKATIDRPGATCHYMDLQAVQNCKGKVLYLEREKLTLVL